MRADTNIDAVHNLIVSERTFHVLMAGEDFEITKYVRELLTSNNNVNYAAGLDKNAYVRTHVRENVKTMEARTALLN